MKRRNFIKAIATGSMCVLAGTTLLNGSQINRKEPQGKYKITVVKRAPHGDGNTDLCYHFKDNQEIIVNSPWIKPECFCKEGWDDIQPCFQEIYYGKSEVSICCCTGFSPVYFKIERVKN